MSFGHYNIKYVEETKIQKTNWKFFSKSNTEHRSETIKQLHKHIMEIEKKKKRVLDAPEFVQRASHGLQSFYILWIDQHLKQGANNSITLDDLVGAGFKMRPYKSIYDAEDFMDKNINKKSKFNRNYSIIVISIGK